MFGEHPGDRYLAELFRSRFRSWPEQLNRFLKLVDQTNLPFSLHEQMRRMEFPGYDGFECGLPDCFYYFVPGSCRGSYREQPENPLSSCFTDCVDGVGVNLGCPLRLYEALRVLNRLPKEAQGEARDGLACATKHLPTVEELLWVSVWNHRSMASRPIVTGKGKSHDWLLQFGEVKIRMECKFAPFTWALIVDEQRFCIHPSFPAGKAHKQLPNPPDSSAINLLAITGLAPVDALLCRSFALALSEHRHIEAVAYRVLNNQLSVFALSEEIASAVGSLILPQAPDEFQVVYPVIWDRKQAALRKEAWEKCRDGQTATVSPIDIFELELSSARPRNTYRMPPLAYRFSLEKHLPTGEPVFKFVPPFGD